MYKAPHCLIRLVASATVFALASISVASAQTRPNPPTDVRVDGQSPQNDRGNPFFLDDFSYVVNRMDAGGIGNSSGSAWTAFTSHGWSAVKRGPTDAGSRGYIYTTTSIPGYSGAMPGLSGSGRVLCLEGLPTTFGGSGINQTDFYLQYGTPGSVHIPANHWYQFWIYINDYGTQRSRWSDGNKFIYPSPPDDDFSVSTGNLPYLWALGTASYETNGTSMNILPYGSAQYPQNRPQYGSSTGADFRIASEYPTNRDKLGSNRVAKTTGYFQPNRWYLVKLHFDNSGTQGTYEMWVREMGQAFQKRAEWIGGVTPNFQFPTVPGHRNGVAAIRMPSTWGTAGSSTSNYDAWVYMADFAIATSEANLPTYGEY